MVQLIRNLVRDVCSQGVGPLALGPPCFIALEVNVALDRLSTTHGR